MKLSLTFALGVFLACAVARAEPVCIIKPGVKLRKGPGSKFATSWLVPKYMPFMKIEVKSSWVKLQDLEGEMHWAPGNVISRKTSCAVVKTRTAKLRKGPGKDQPAAELASVDRYTPFKKVDRDGEWVKVADAFGGTYWIHETNIWIPVNRTRIAF